MLIAPLGRREPFLRVFSIKYDAGGYKMLDLRFVRENPEIVKENIKKKLSLIHI